jgi:hypothetical protein
MDIGSFFLIIALLILVGLYISRPFFEGRKAKVLTRQEHDLSALLAEKERTLTALQELEFDALLGKIPEEIYPTQRVVLVQRGAELLQQIDQLDGQAGDGGAALSARDRLEAIVVDRRSAQASVVPVGSNGGNHADDPVEALIAARRRTRQEKAAGFCHQCGSPLQQSDRFCPKCGTLVK